MLETEQYPTTTQGDSIAIAHQLFNKYQPSLNKISLPRLSSSEQIPFKHYFN